MNRPFACRLIFIYIMQSKGDAMKPSSAQSDLLAEPVPRAILKTALPSMFAMLLTSLCALLDSFLLGRHSAAGSAAVSLSFPLTMMIQTIGFTFGMGSGSFVSRSLGAGDKKAALDAASVGFYGALFLSGAMCTLGFISVRPLLTVLGAQASNLAQAVVYARCVLASGPLLCANLALSSLLRAQGKTIPNLAAFGAGAVIGSLLQWLLIARMDFGILGSGIAMFVREGATLIILLIAQKRCRCAVRPRLFLFSLRPVRYAPIVRYGLPTLVRQGMACASSVLLSRISSSFGEASLAGVGLSVRLCTVVSSAVIGFGQGFQPVCGYAFGAGQMDRVREAYRFCMRCAVISLLLLSIPAFFFARRIVSPFCATPEILGVAAASLRAQSAVFFAQGAIILMNMLTQAMGMTVRASLVASSRQGYVLLLMLWILPRIFGLPGLLLCQSASDLLSLILCALITRRALPAEQAEDFSR